MSGRAKRTDAPVSKYVEVESDVDMDEEERNLAESEGRRGSSAFVAPVKKKARKSKRKSAVALEPAVNESDGSLSSFVEMPLDIISEIFTHLHLRDVLAFSRLSKMFRSLLNSELKGLWTAARLRLSLPLPLGMTEVQLANLCYGTNCYFCGKDNKAHIIFASRARACNKCYKNEVHLRNYGTYLMRLPQVDILHPQAKFCIPHQKLGGRWDREASYRVFAYEGRMLYLDEAIESASDELHAFSFEGNVVDQNQGRSARVARRSLGSPAAAPRNEALNAFVAEKVRWVKQLQADTVALQSAYHASERREQTRIKEEQRRRSEIWDGRWAAVIAKAVSLGYEEVHMTLLPYLFNSLFTFSEEEFDEKRAAFVAQCESLKEDAIRNERRRAERDQRQRQALDLRAAS